MDLHPRLLRSRLTAHPGAFHAAPPVPGFSGFAVVALASNGQPTANADLYRLAYDLVLAQREAAGRRVRENRAFGRISLN